MYLVIKFHWVIIQQHFSLSTQKCFNIFSPFCFGDLNFELRQSIFVFGHHIFYNLFLNSFFLTTLFLNFKYIICTSTTPTCTPTTNFVKVNYILQNPNFKSHESWEIKLFLDFQFYIYIYILFIRNEKFYQERQDLQNRG